MLACNLSFQLRSQDIRIMQVSYSMPRTPSTFLYCPCKRFCSLLLKSELLHAFQTCVVAVFFRYRGVRVAGAHKIEVWNITPRLISWLLACVRMSHPKFDVTVTFRDRARGFQSSGLIVNKGQNLRSLDLPQIKILL